MMDCKKALRLMPEMVGKSEAGTGLAEHLKDCPGCRAEFQALKELTERMGSLEVPEPPAGFWEAHRSGVRAALADRGLAERHLPSWLVWLSGWPGGLVPAALAAMLVAALLLTMQKGPGPVGAEAPAMVELMESGVVPVMELDEVDASIAVAVLGGGQGDGLYYDLLALEDDELEELYDSLGKIMESM